MYVYLISSEINNEKLYKIGITRREVKKRLKELKTGNPANLKIVEIFESDYGTKIESQIHRLYSFKKIGGEWFELENEDIVNFISICKKIEHNLKLLSNNTYIVDRGYI
jgi:hypothetical protein